ncbi:hypothetical protein D3C85_808570 [compost metagenome]
MLVPPAVVTRTSTIPVPAGVVAVIWVVLLTVTSVASAPSKVTAAPPAKFIPIMITVVPPEDGPEPGETAVTVGAGS